MGAWRRVLFREILWPAQEQISGRAFLREKRALASFQWRSPEDIATYQEIRLGATVRHAYRTVPFYRQLFESRGFGPRDFGLDPKTLAGNPDPLDPDVFRHLPVTTRRDLDEQPPEAMASNAAQDERAQDTDDRRIATAALFNDWAGLSPGGWRVSFQPPPGDPRDREIRRVMSADSRVYIPLELVRARDGEAIAAFLERVRPDAVYGYPSLLGPAAEALRERGWGSGDSRHRAGAAGGRERPSLKAVVYYGESGMDPATHDLVREVCGAPVFWRYGVREFATWIAQTCPSQAADGPAGGNLHVNANGFYVEVVDATGRPVPAGQEGRLLVTDLRDRTTPLVRYDVGDTGVLAPERCACGRGLPLLVRLQGAARTTVRASSRARLACSSPYSTAGRIRTSPQAF